MRIIISLVLTALLFTGCEETKKVIDTAGRVQLSGTYNVTMAGAQKVTKSENSITFRALDNSVSGNAGCNDYFGNYTLDLYALNFGPIGVTEQYCDENIMKVERNVLNALRDTGSYTLENDVLTLLSKNDRSVLLKASKVKTTN
ncbi:META domain-containing protein [Rasiella sp. SM2506]|uniref:META domain-containing protein n=1 Tax=Rasiella sp. SM2506 TaxID=3423914 RepID=UPI003D7B0E95